MGISRLDAWAIQCREVSVVSVTDAEHKRYGFHIYLMNGEEIDRLSVSTQTLPYSNDDGAVSEGNKLVNEIRGMDLGNPYKVLEQIAGKENARTVSNIVETSKNLEDSL